ncbi:MAG: hypothetical protein NTV54_03245, partial [Ignavibacteriales bacterium]|nr:hypothetical protein [Ignavibacteriales bacterium]
MNRFSTYCTFTAVLLFIVSFASQAQWKTVLTTWDGTDYPNATGQQTASVSAINDNAFVALVIRPSILYRADAYDDVNILKDSCTVNYLVSYGNPTDTSGRKDRIPYSSTTLFTKWVSGFDEISMFRAYKVHCTPDSLAYVANNDPDHNILVFRMTKDSTISTDYRMKTGTVDIMGLSVDNNGYVYVCAVNGTAANTKEIKIFKGIKASGTTWGLSYDDQPVQSIDLPTGVYRGIAVSRDGKQIFVSCMTDRSVYRYVGSPTTGYSKDTKFAFQLTIADSISTSSYDTTIAGQTVKKWDMSKPLGMGYLDANNILFVATARWLGYSIKTHNATSAYTHSKLFMLNGSTGARYDSLDIADYYYINSDSTGLNRSYTTQICGPVVHIAGYASTYDVSVTPQKNIYTQSMYCWAVEKWVYKGTLKVFSGVEKISSNIPEHWSLAQNYPNPFNPTT